MKKRTSLLFFPLILLAAFIYFLSNYFPIEEILVYYLLPFLIFSILFAIYYVIRRLFDRKTSISSVISKILIASSAFNILFLAVCLYITYPHYLKKEDAIKDIDYMVKTFEDVHPNLYNRISREKFYADVDSIKRNFPQKISLDNFYLNIAALSAVFRDGHTTPYINYLVANKTIFFKKMFPYKIKIEDNRIFVVKNYSYNDQIEPGSEILKINGISSGKVIEEAGKLISYRSVVFRNYLLSNPIYLSTWNKYKDFQITYKDISTGKIKKITTCGGLYAKLQLQKDIRSDHSNLNYEFKVLKGNTGYIGFYHFVNLQKFRSFLKETFQQIKDKGIRNLIIDIRQNGGGNSALGNELLQYISHVPFRQFDKTIVKISKEVISNKIISEKFNNRIDSLQVYNDTTGTSLRVNPLRFNGNCYLLTGSGTYSSAVDFASAFQCFQIGKIIGSETGGVTVSYGDVFNFKLPESGIIMGVSFKKFYNACGVDNGSGVIPDYIINNTVSDDINNYDRVLNFTLDLINKTRK